MLILHERVCLPPQNAQNIALKLLNRGTFGYKKGWEPLKCCRPSVCTYHMEYIHKCFYHLSPRTSLFTRLTGVAGAWARLQMFFEVELVGHALAAYTRLTYTMAHCLRLWSKILLWNRYMEVRLAVKRDEPHFNFDFQVFAHITWDMYKVFVQSRKCFNTNTPQTRKLITQKETRFSKLNIVAIVEWGVTKKNYNMSNSTLISKKGLNRSCNVCLLYRESLPLFLKAAAHGYLGTVQKCINDNICDNLIALSGFTCTVQDHIKSLHSLRDRNGWLTEHWDAGGRHLECLSYLLQIQYLIWT